MFIYTKRVQQNKCRKLGTKTNIAVALQQQHNIRNNEKKECF